MSGVLLLVMVGCSPVQAEDWPTPTPSPTARPTPTRTPRPTVTPTARPTPLCGVPPVTMGLHLSGRGSYTETQRQAAGAATCRIERESCAYYHLVDNRSAKIIFKQEEEPPYHEEDRLMHMAMLLPLDQLARLVEAEWEGAFQLRVTDAYDSLLEHNLVQGDEQQRVSLHFEGRAVDLTTWPTAPEYYSRLCALAHCAGFDWVHNEGDHCHAAIRADSLCALCETK